MQPNFNIVTAVYFSSRTNIHGGRGWTFQYYLPVIYAMTKITSGKITIYHDSVQEDAIKHFIDTHNITNIICKKVELIDLPYHNEVYELKKRYIEERKIDLEEWGSNGVFHIVLLNKLWFMQQTIKDLNLSEDDPITWIDAGLFHHALFPETLGGVELFKFDTKNYYPENNSSKFNFEFGMKIQKALTSEKVLAFGNKQMSITAGWPYDLYGELPPIHIIGGMFGSKVSSIKKISQEFYLSLDKLIEHKSLIWEEGIFSYLYKINPDKFKISTFSTWYHDVPDVPNYFEGVFSGYEDTPELRPVSFYKKYFHALENDDFTDVPAKEISYVQIISKSLDYNKYSNLPNIAVYGSHNASVAIEHRGEILEIVEIERFLNVKNAGYAQYYVAASRKYLANLILDYFKNKYGFTEYGYCLHQHCETIEDDTKVFYWNQFPAKEYVECKHHESHMAGTFYQSPYNKALVISFDGGGNDGFFKVYLTERNSKLKLLKEYRFDLGFSYMVFGEYLADIKKESALNLANLVYAGKILGLQSYGSVVEEWLESFKDFYKSQPQGTDYQVHIDMLGEKIGVKFDEVDRLTGETAYNIAATSQAAFEELFFEMVDDVIKDNPDLPICLTGGCALNIVLNTKIKHRYNREVFVGPNPNDCGLAVGMLAQLIKPEKPIDVTYKGIPLLDKDKLPEYIEKYNSDTVTLEELAYEIRAGKIVGFIQGNSEHGPRALGNRSILCNPLVPDMKDILNAKVKNREWYRPFAPVVRLEDVAEYFEWDGEVRWMSFCPKVKDEWKEKLPSITHIDGTARVQTVTREQNEKLYDLITEFKKITGIGVLLNTSFNVNGKPITSTLSDAFKLWESTQLNSLYIDGFYFKDKMGVHSL